MHETVPHRATLWVGAAFCSMSGAGILFYGDSFFVQLTVLFLFSAPPAKPTHIGMKSVPSYVAANLLTRHVREAHANSLGLSQKGNPACRQERSIS